jgi:hypothetical protein
MHNYREEIVKVEVLDSSELQLVLGGGGNASYQHIYREAKGVYWDNDAGAFKGTERVKWSFAEWFAHIVQVCGNIGITLYLSDTAEWVGVPEPDKQEILAAQTA